MAKSVTVKYVTSAAGVMQEAEELVNISQGGYANEKQAKSVFK